MPNEDFSIKTGIEVDDSKVSQLKSIADELEKTAKALQKINNVKFNGDIFSGLTNAGKNIQNVTKEIDKLQKSANGAGKPLTNIGKGAESIVSGNSKQFTLLDLTSIDVIKSSMSEIAASAQNLKEALGSEVTSGLMTQIDAMLAKKDELQNLANILKSNKEDLGKAAKATGSNKNSPTLEKTSKYVTDKSFTGDLKYLINTEAENKVLSEYHSNTEEYKKLKEERLSVLNRTNGKTGNNTVEKNLEQKLKDTQKVINQNIGKYGEKIEKAFADMDSLKNAKSNISGMNDMFNSGYQDITKWASAVASGSMSIETFQNKVGKLQTSLNNVYKVINNPNEGTAEVELQNFLREMSGLDNLDFGKTNIKNGLATLSGSFKDASGNVQTLTAQLNLASGAMSRVSTSSAPIASGIDKFFSGWKTKMANLAQYVASFQAMNKVWETFKQGLEVVKDFDTALTEMRKVSDEPISKLKEFQKESFDMAKSVGTTALQIQNSTADFQRLGESFSDAKQSAVNANKLLNVSEFNNIDDATSALISMKAAYSEVAESDLVDKVNQVGERFMPKHMVTCGEFLYSL